MIKPTEKSNFSQTCNLLSNYLKEKKGSFGDLMNTGVVTSSNLQSTGKPETVNHNVSSMDRFPQHATTAEEAATPQLTIFYAGKVLVFNDLPADKAREIMFLASNGSSQKLSSTSPTSSTSSNDPFNNTTFATSNSNQGCFHLLARSSISDLPIARKASLQRFLEKRKGRISAKAPYPLVNNSAAESYKQDADHSKVWLNLMASHASIRN